MDQTADDDVLVADSIKPERSVQIQTEPDEHITIEVIGEDNGTRSGNYFFSPIKTSSRPGSSSKNGHTILGLGLTQFRTDILEQQPETPYRLPSLDPKQTELSTGTKQGSTSSGQHRIPNSVARRKDSTSSVPKEQYVTVVKETASDPPKHYSITMPKDTMQNPYRISLSSLTMDALEKSSRPSRSTDSVLTSISNTLAAQSLESHASLLSPRLGIVATRVRPKHTRSTEESKDDDLKTPLTPRPLTSPGRTRERKQRLHSDSELPSPRRHSTTSMGFNHSSSYSSKSSKTHGSYFLTVETIQRLTNGGIPNSARYRRHSIDVSTPTQKTPVDTTELKSILKNGSRRNSCDNSGYDSSSNSSYLSVNNNSIPLQNPTIKSYVPPSDDIFEESSEELTSHETCEDFLKNFHYRLPTESTKSSEPISKKVTFEDDVTTVMIAPRPKHRMWRKKFSM